MNQDTPPTTTEGTGKSLRALREAKGIKAVFVCKKMDVSASYLSDLERDRRAWNDDLIARFKAAIGA